MNSKDKTFLEKFVQKNQIIWIALEIFRLQGFPLQPGWGGTPPISQKLTKTPPIRVLPSNIDILSKKTLLSLLPIVTWNRTLKSKN